MSYQEITVERKLESEKDFFDLKRSFKRFAEMNKYNLLSDEKDKLEYEYSISVFKINSPIKQKHKAKIYIQDRDVLLRIEVLANNYYLFTEYNNIFNEYVDNMEKYIITGNSLKPLILDYDKEVKKLSGVAFLKNLVGDYSVWEIPSIKNKLLLYRIGIGIMAIVIFLISFKSFESNALAFFNTVLLVMVLPTVGIVNFYISKIKQDPILNYKNYNMFFWLVLSCMISSWGMSSQFITYSIGFTPVIIFSLFPFGLFYLSRYDELQGKIDSNKILILIACYVFSFLLSMNLFQLVNSRFDLSEPTLTNVEVLDKREVKHSKSSDYYLTIKTQSVESEEISVPGRPYHSLKQGDIALVKEYGGLFGYPWYTVELDVNTKAQTLDFKNLETLLPESVK